LWVFFFIKNVIFIFAFRYFNTIFKRSNSSYYKLICIFKWKFIVYLWCDAHPDEIYVCFCFLSLKTIAFQLCTIAWPRAYQCNIPSHNLCTGQHTNRLDIPWYRTRVIRAKVRHSNHYATAAFPLLIVYCECSLKIIILAYPYEMYMQ